jgi:hypothetical protein
MAYHQKIEKSKPCLSGIIISKQTHTLTEKMASSNIFRTTNYGYNGNATNSSNGGGENRFRNDNRGSYGTDMSGNRGSYNDNRGSYRSSYRNQFSGTVTQQQAPVEVMKPMPPMEEFPSLLRRPVATKVVEPSKPVEASFKAEVPSKVDVSKPVEAPTSSFAIIAKKAASIVVPKKPEPVVNDEYYEPEAVAYRAPSGRPQMSIQEFIQRREDGQRIEMDDVSICSEYSNCVIDSDSDDDDF